MGKYGALGILCLLKKSKKINDEYPLYARISLNGERTEISLKKSISVTISDTYWDKGIQRLQENAPNSESINSFIDSTTNSILEAYQQLKASGKFINAQTIKARVVGEDFKHPTLMQLVDYHRVRMLEVLTYGSMKNYSATEKYLQRFLEYKYETSDIFLKQLSYKFIIDFEHYLRTTKPLQKGRPLQNNGIMKHLARLKKIANLGMKLEWMDKNPFIRFQLKMKKFDRAFLNQNEIDVIEALDLKTEGMSITRDMFIFSCYTGLAYADLRGLTGNDISKGIDGEYWIFIKRQKNNIPVKVPLLKKPMDIIQKYENIPKLEFNPKLLPVYCNQKTNQYLKKIAILADIQKNLSFHVARHTFATTITLSNGVPIETVSKLLGHTKISTTQIYARVLEGKLSADMALLQSKLIEQKTVVKHLG